MNIKIFFEKCIIFNKYVSIIKLVLPDSEKENNENKYNMQYNIMTIF